MLESGVDPNKLDMEIEMGALIIAIKNDDMRAFNLLVSNPRFDAERNYLPVGGEIWAPLSLAIYCANVAKPRYVMISALLAYYDPLTSRQSFPMLLYSVLQNKKIFWFLCDYLQSEGRSAELIEELGRYNKIISRYQTLQEEDKKLHKNNPIALRLIDNVQNQDEANAEINKAIELLSKDKESKEKEPETAPTLFRETPKISSSPFTILRELHGWSREDFKEEKLRKKQVAEEQKTLSPVIMPRIPTIHTWFDDQIDSSFSCISPIEGDLTFGESFIWLLESELINQGCSKESYRLFNNRVYKFGEFSVKSLTDVPLKVSFCCSWQLTCRY